MRSVLYIMLMQLLLVVKGDHSEKELIMEECYRCAFTNGGDNKICRVGSVVNPKTDAIACCQQSHQGSGAGGFAQSNSCYQADQQYLCTRPFNELAHRFWKYCPAIPKEDCGGEYELMATNEKQTFKFDKLRAPKVCQFKVGFKPLTYDNKQWLAIRGGSLVNAREGANITITVNQIGADVKLYITNGSRVQVMQPSKSDSEGGNTYTIDGYLESEDIFAHEVQAYDIYEKYVLQYFSVFAVPEKDATDTAFEITYSTDGKPMPWIEQRYYTVNETLNLNMKFGAFVAWCVLLIIVILILIVLYCLYLRKQRQEMRIQEEKDEIIRQEKLEYVQSLTSPKSRGGSTPKAIILKQEQITPKTIVELPDMENEDGKKLKQLDIQKVNPQLRVTSPPTARRGDTALGKANDNTPRTIIFSE